MRIPPLIGREFPDPSRAPADRPLAWGGDLAVQTLLAAYRRGIFPWFSEGDPILWWSPDPRAIFEPGGMHIARRLRRKLKSARFVHSRNMAFSAVIRCCAHVKRKQETGTWLVPAMIEAYEALNRCGYAESFEVWEQGRLIGGLYGVRIGKAFFAESMFSLAPDGSKMALAKMHEASVAEGWQLIDVQFLTPHLARLGARTIPRSAFLSRLAKAIG